MSNSKNIGSCKGTRQSDRLPSALSDNYCKIDERSFNDLIHHIAEYAKKVNFYGDNDELDGNWEPFFKEIYNYETQSIELNSLQKQMNDGSVPPHLALLLSFLKLYQIQQNNLNKLAERHLDFYYKNVLGFSPREGRVGNAVVFVSPMKNTPSVILPKGTLFDAGKDSDGKNITFESIEEVTINNAEVNGCYYYYLANNGNYEFTDINCQDEKQHLHDVRTPNDAVDFDESKFGLAMAIPTFFQAKNVKNIDLGTFGEKINLDFFDVEYTGEGGWVKVDAVRYIYQKTIAQEYISNEKRKEMSTFLWEKIVPQVDYEVYYKEISYKDIIGIAEKKGLLSKAKKMFVDAQKDHGQKKHYYLHIDGVREPVAPYNSRIHGEGYDSVNPIIRFVPKDKNIIKDKKDHSWDLLDITRESFEGIYLQEVGSTDNITIENKYGMVNNVTGCHPFGYNGIEITAEGKSSVRYKRLTVNYSRPNTTDYFLVKINTPSREIDYKSNKNKTYSINVEFCEEFKVEKTEITNNSEFPVFKYTPDYSKGEISASSTPVELKESITYDSNIHIPTGRMELFAITPWGILKNDGENNNLFANDSHPSLCYHKNNDNNKFKSGLFIAISNIFRPTCLSLYFELGKFNVEKLPVSWEYLDKDNKWHEFDRMNLYKDGTCNFTRNGVVQIYLDDNVFYKKRYLPTDVIWLFAKIDSKSDSKIEFLKYVKSIRTQAVEVMFSENSAGTIKDDVYLPKGTITKLVKNIKGIKKVEQPFDGFVGVSTETKDEFYCRVSEKLHHKGKAWSCWDYERILLEKYPQLAAVKCTPCSSNPGTVKIVVFPNVSLVPQDNIFRPQIDAFTQDEIERFLPTISSPFVKFTIVSPDYEMKEIRSTIVLKQEYHDDEYYRGVIREELINYLTPWLNDPMNVSFDSIIPEEHDILFFLEKLEYVDYIKTLDIYNKSASSDSDTGHTIKITIEKE